MADVIFDQDFRQVVAALIIAHGEEKTIEETVALAKRYVDAMHIARGKEPATQYRQRW